jgi:hypothetical protein
VRIRANGETLCVVRARFEPRGIVTGAQRWIVKRGHERFLDQLVTHSSAGPMSHHDLFVMSQGRRADGTFDVDFFVGHEVLKAKKEERRKMP